MKRLLLTILSVGTIFTVQAQLRLQSKPIVGTEKAYMPVPMIKTNVSGNEFPLAPVNETVIANHRIPSSAFMANSIGNTTYDLQSNASMGNRVIQYNGDVSATWTMSFSGDLAAADRGSGYNYKPSAGSWGTPPSSRLESVKTGWPSLARTAAGTEHIISHISGAPLNMESSPAGGSSWTNSSLPSVGPPEVLWGSLAAGGPDGNSLHALMITLPTPNAGAVFNGLDGCPIYQRSLDNGQTWDITNKIPDGVDSTNTSGWSGDSYTIASKGNTVAFVHGQVTDDWAVWISHDNGDTWTKTVIMDFPFVKYDDVNNMTDVDGDGVADTVLTTDHKMAILIDNNGMVHCWAGALYVLDLDIPSQLGLFLSTDALLYWNESMGSAQPVVIAQTPDVDGDGQLTFAPNYVPRYGNGGQCSQPYAAIDASGTIIVSFAAPLENSTTGTTGADYSYRNIWMIGSTDNGVTWSDPIQVAGSEFDEAVFGSLARDINGCVDLVYQMDGLPGIAVQPPNSNQAFHPFSSNDIMHDCIPVTSIVGIKEIQQ